MKAYLIAFMAGSLVTGGALGTVGYFKINALNKENTHLQTKLKEQDWRQENLTKSQVRLEEELTAYKEKKAQGYDQTIGALMQAKENADIHALYEIGIKALQEKDYPRAYFALSQVEKNHPQFKDIQKQYPESKKAYDKYQQILLDTKLKNLYAQASDHQANQQFAQAQSYFQQVLDLKPTYKDARARLNTVTQYLATRQQTREWEQRTQWLEATYKLGLNEQGYGRYAQAKAAYQNILDYAPQYKDTARRFKTVSALIPKSPPPTKTGNAASMGQNNACYEKGVAFGKCATLGSEAENCAEADMSRLSLECKDNPEFAKGIKSTVSSSGPAATLLRDLPTLLKNL